MTQVQITRLLDLLETIATKSTSYTITGAADWPLLVAMGVMVMGLIGIMWRDLRAGQKDQKEDIEKDIDHLWKGMRDCQADCCLPRADVKFRGSKRP